MEMYNQLPQPFLGRWGGCLALPQHRWGPLGLATPLLVTPLFASYLEHL